MRPAAMLAAAVLLVPLEAAAAEVVEKERGFAVTFPKPHQVKDLPGGQGALRGKQWIHEAAGEAYVLTCFAFADLSGDQDPRLDGMREAVSAQLGAKPLGERLLASEGRPGREFSMDAAMGLVRVRLFIDKRGLQTCNLLALGGRKNDAKATAFLQSFRFLSPPNPETLSVPEAGFEATFPASTHQQVLTLPEGPVRSFRTDCEGVNYSINIVMPKTKLDGDPEKRLDGARDGMLAKVKEAKLLSESKLALAGRPGREIELSAAGGLRMRVRMFLDARKNRMAQVMVVGRPERLTPGVAAFLDSFRFLDDPGKGR